jgi:hypothetical protein
MSNTLKKIGARIVFAFTGLPAEMKESCADDATEIIEPVQHKGFDWNGVGNGAPGPRNNYGTKSGLGF